MPFMSYLLVTPCLIQPANLATTQNQQLVGLVPTAQKYVSQNMVDFNTSNKNTGAYLLMNWIINLNTPLAWNPYRVKPVQEHHNKTFYSHQVLMFFKVPVMTLPVSADLILRLCIHISVPESRSSIRLRLHSR